MSLPVMLFAAGFGTRMGALTRHCPKPLIPVAGRPLIAHTVDLARAAGGDPLVANTHYLADQMRTYLEPRGILISDEQPEILDTGGGLRQALPLLGSGPVITMNTDAIWDGPNPVELALSQWDPDRMDALLVCVPLPRAAGRKGGGDFSADEQRRITRGGNLVYGGVQILDPSGLRQIPDQTFSLNLLWNEMLETGRLFAVEYPGRWCDVGHPEGIALAEAVLRGDYV
ncbi:MAG: NTP transferase domain-containing protein [Rhodobacteraceae bacterium]|nr:NTP transferase domain-containing protein [Paracoccaceae bacterium]